MKTQEDWEDIVITNINIFSIGDAMNPRDYEGATRQGLESAMQVLLFQREPDNTKF